MLKEYDFFYNVIIATIKTLIVLHLKCRLIIIISIGPKWTRLLNQDFLTNY